MDRPHDRRHSYKRMTSTTFTTLFVDNTTEVTCNRTSTFLPTRRPLPAVHYLRGPNTVSGQAYVITGSSLSSLCSRDIATYPRQSIWSLDSISDCQLMSRYIYVILELTPLLLWLREKERPWVECPVYLTIRCIKGTSCSSYRLPFSSQQANTFQTSHAPSSGGGGATALQKSCATTHILLHL